MKERTGSITFQGNPLTLLGNELNIGDKAPDFELLDNDLNPVYLSSFGGKVCVISSVPSLSKTVVRCRRGGESNDPF
jgi:thiol peroxidase